MANITQTSTPEEVAAIVSGSLRNMPRRSFGARSFDGFWRHWNPLFGYYLGKYVFVRLKKVAPPHVALVSFSWHGRGTVQGNRNGYQIEFMGAESRRPLYLLGRLPRAHIPCFHGKVTRQKGTGSGRLQQFIRILNERLRAVRADEQILPREDFLEFTFTFADSRLPREDHGPLGRRNRPLKCYDSAC